MTEQIIQCDKCQSTNVAHYDKPQANIPQAPYTNTMETIVFQAQGPVSVKPAVLIRPRPKRLECMNCGYMIEYMPDGSISILPEVKKFQVAREENESIMLGESKC